MKRTWILGCVLGALWCSVLAAETPSWTFTTVDFPGFASVTSPIGMNDHGDIVGYYNDSTGAFHGYLRPAGGDFVSIDFPGAVRTHAADINDDGDIVGTYFDPAGFQHGFLLRDGVYSSIDFPGAAQIRGIIFELGSGLGTAAWGLNDDGDIVGEYAGSDMVAHGFLLRDGQFTSFDVPGFAQTPGTETVATQINSSGDIVGGIRPSGFHGQQGFLLQDGEFTLINVPDAGGGFGTFATGLNDQGDIAGPYTQVGYDFNGFVRIDGQYITIDIPGARHTETYRITNDQTIIGGYQDQDRRTHGYIGVRNP